MEPLYEDAKAAVDTEQCAVLSPEVSAWPRACARANESLVTK